MDDDLRDKDYNPDNDKEYRSDHDILEDTEQQKVPIIDSCAAKKRIKKEER